MKVLTNYQNLNSINFCARIIDSHAHIGSLNGLSYNKDNLDVFVRSNLPNNDTVEKMFVSNLDVLTGKLNEYEGNIQTKQMFENDEKYKLFIACSPNNGSVENIKRLYKDNPKSFIGLKFHPTIQGLPLSDNKYEEYINFADKHKLPCLFHSAVLTDENGRLTKKLEISDPSHIYLLAKKHNKTPFVMAHLGAGWHESHDKAIDVLVESIKKGDANLYADISWVDIDAEIKNGKSAKEHIIKAIKQLKGIGVKDWKYGDQSFRLMFGTDAPIDRFNNSTNKDAVKNYTKFIDDIKFAIRNDKELGKDAESIIDDLFYNNAKKLYLSYKKKTYPKVITGIVLLAILSFGLYKYNKKSQPKPANTH